LSTINRTYVSIAIVGRPSVSTNLPVSITSRRQRSRNTIDNSGSDNNPSNAAKSCGSSFTSIGSEPGALDSPQAQPQHARARSRQADATLLLASAEHADQHDAPLTEHAYDTPERRRALAEQLTRAGVEPDAVEAAILADTSQAHPPESAVADMPRPGTRARRGPGSAARREITRQDRGR